MEKEMIEALRKDQEILEAMTGEEHHLYFLEGDGNIIPDTLKAAQDRIAALEAQVAALTPKPVDDSQEADPVGKADPVAEAALFAELLGFYERHSNRWDGVNGRHPAIVIAEARAITEASHADD